MATVHILLVAAGGAIGSALRYLLSGAVQGLFPNSAFPWGTLVVNAAGCFAIGVVAQLAEGRGLLGPETRTFLMVGLLGGFTTFSAFSHETVSALRDGVVPLAVANVVLSMVLCLGAVWAGRVLAYELWR
jgi:CrcB protein